MKTQFGQLIIGPPGSGKTTYCKTISKFLSDVGRKVVIVNLDPANESVEDLEFHVDICELITICDVMDHMNLGPNGGLMYAIEYLETHVKWLLDKLNLYQEKPESYYFLFDCPGQVELYMHHCSMKNILSILQNKLDMRLCCVNLIDSHYCSDPGKYISTLLLSLTMMLHLELPHVNVLSKMDLAFKHKNWLSYGLDYYTEVLDLQYILEQLQEDPVNSKFKKLNTALVSLVEDFSLVHFHPLNKKDNRTVVRLSNAIDKANGYVYGTNEQRNIQALLSCAIGAESEQEKIGMDRDIYA
uniref:GPN-loop GTPase 2 n=1 Tax=Cacopsylla melanoneura TaxID=428564 RepID=A0A8D8UUI9_9HEMI